MNKISKYLLITILFSVLFGNGCFVEPIDDNINKILHHYSKENGKVENSGLILWYAKNAEFEQAVKFIDQHIGIKDACLAMDPKQLENYFLAFVEFQRYLRENEEMLINSVDGSDYPEQANVLSFDEKVFPFLTTKDKTLLPRLRFEYLTCFCDYMCGAISDYFSKDRRNEICRLTRN